LKLLGTGNIDGTGNTGNNTIIGNSGNNKLNGKEGSDTLTGNGGNDIFVFDTKIATDKRTSQPTNSDHITDFISGTDAIDLSVKIFLVYKTAFNTAHATSVEVDLNGSFDSGAGLTTASTTDIHFIYNTSTGNLYYDADGSGTTKAAIQFATLDGAATLQASDLHIFG
jgi:Ca2+-binding RTX toxin-like protein